MNLTFMRDSNKIFDGRVDAVILNSSCGQVELLDGHIPAIFMVHKCLELKAGGKSMSYEFESGFAYTNGEVCFVVVDC